MSAPDAALPEQPPRPDGAWRPDGPPLPDKRLGDAGPRGFWRALWRPAPPSLAWLLRQELRLVWRGQGQLRKRRTLLIALLGMLVMSHAIGLAFGVIWTHLPNPTAKQAILSAICPLIFCGMLGGALLQMVNALFIRGDFDLLLSAPIAPRTILPIKAGAVAVAGVLSWMLLSVGIADAGLWFGHPSWLVAYPVVVSLALLATTLGLVLTLALVRWIGARRTRVVGQALALTIGILGGAAGQLPGATMRQHGGAATALQALSLPADSPWLWPGRFMQGDPWLLPPVLAFSILAFALACTRLAPAFMATAVLAASLAPKRRAPPRATRFGTALLPLLLRHEARLIRRNPHLPLYLFQQVGSLAPVLVVLALNGPEMRPYLWAAAVPLVGFLAGALTKLVRGDMVGDLGDSAPVPARLRQQAKLTAAILPALALLLPLALAAALAQSPRAGAMVVLCGAGAITTGVMFSLWVQPGMADMMVQQRRFGGGGAKTGKVVRRQIGENLIGMSWGVVTGLAMGPSYYGGLIAGLVALGLLGLTYIFKAPL